MAKFILDNTKGVTIGPIGNEYKDPFTGDCAYVPGDSSQGATAPVKAATQFYPKSSYLTFEQANVHGILSK